MKCIDCKYYTEVEGCIDCTYCLPTHPVNLRTINNKILVEKFHEKHCKKHKACSNPHYASVNGVTGNMNYARAEEHNKHEECEYFCAIDETKFDVPEYPKIDILLLNEEPIKVGDELSVKAIVTLKEYTPLLYKWYKEEEYDGIGDTDNDNGSDNANGDDKTGENDIQGSGVSNVTDNGGDGESNNVEVVKPKLVLISEGNNVLSIDTSKEGTHIYRCEVTNSDPRCTDRITSTSAMTFHITIEPKETENADEKSTVTELPEIKPDENSEYF